MLELSIPMSAALTVSGTMMSTSDDLGTLGRSLAMRVDGTDMVLVLGEVLSIEGVEAVLLARLRRVLT